MRDVQKLREKTQFSLEDRQLAALAAGLLGLIGAAFVLGVMVGKRISPQAAPAPDLALLDARVKNAPEPVVPAPPPAEAAREPPSAARESTGDKPRETQGRTSSLVPPPRPTTIVAPPQQPVQVASTGPAALTPPPRELGQYTVQIGASQDRAEAQRLEARARAKGLHPYALQADLGPKGVWYRVRVGAFRDKDAAVRFRDDVARELRGAAVVMPSR